MFSVLKQKLVKKKSLKGKQKDQTPGGSSDSEAPRLCTPKEMKYLLNVDYQKIAYEFKRQKQFNNQKKIKRGGLNGQNGTSMMQTSSIDDDMCVEETIIIL